MRPISDDERGLLRVLIGTEDFGGRSEIAEQLSNAQVEEIDPDGSLRFVVLSQRRAPIKCRIPVEAQFLDTDGIQGHLLLHVVNGQVAELEVYKDDSSRVIKRPRPEDLEVIVTPSASAPSVKVD